MREGAFIVEGDIGDLNEKVFKQLNEEFFIFNIAQADVIEETGGGLHGIKVKNNKICLNKKNNLLRARVIFEIS